jgi:hypothetical protein
MKLDLLTMLQLYDAMKFAQGPKYKIKHVHEAKNDVKFSSKSWFHILC